MLSRCKIKKLLKKEIYVLLKMWDANNKSYNYSRTFLEWFNIGKSAFDASLMVDDTLDLFTGIAKDFAGTVSKYYYSSECIYNNDTYICYVLLDTNN